VRLPVLPQLRSRAGARVPAAIARRVRVSGHIYDVWVNFIGVVESGGPFTIPPDHDGGPTIEIRAYNDADRYTPKPALFGDQTVGRIEVRVALPWVLPERDPEMLSL
jgi:hypothetical protein